MEETGNCYHATDELQGGDGKAAKRKSGASNKRSQKLAEQWGNKGFAQKCFKRRIYQCGYLFAVRKAIKRNSPRN